MKLDELELSLLFDYYGELLTEKQRTCFELYYNQDFSLGEIAQEAGISRQAVHDALVRAEGSLRLMEVKIGAAARRFDLPASGRPHPGGGGGPGLQSGAGDGAAGSGDSGCRRYHEGVDYGV